MSDIVHPKLTANEVKNYMQLGNSYISPLQCGPSTQSVVVPVGAVRRCGAHFVHLCAEDVAARAIVAV